MSGDKWHDLFAALGITAMVSWIVAMWAWGLSTWVHGWPLVPASIASGLVFAAGMIIGVEHFSAQVRGSSGEEE